MGNGKLSSFSPSTVAELPAITYALGIMRLLSAYTIVILTDLRAATLLLAPPATSVSTIAVGRLYTAALVERRQTTTVQWIPAHTCAPEYYLAVQVSRSFTGYLAQYKSVPDPVGFCRKLQSPIKWTLEANYAKHPS